MGLRRKQWPPYTSGEGGEKVEEKRGKSDET